MNRIYVVKIKSWLCWLRSEDVNIESIQPQEYLDSFDNLADAVNYKNELDTRELLPPRGTTPFSNYYYNISQGRLSDRFYGETERWFHERSCFNVLSSMSESKFIQELQCQGIIQEKKIGYKNHDWQMNKSVVNWYDWWCEAEPRLNDQQRQKVWKMLDKLDMYEILTLEMDQ